ncbi:MAG: alanyl-tRNA editing protein [Alphaproteobacteria bacterium]|nr:alanyl-tRNA editing protein [Alphaproteobacteria bacterium]MCY4317822.1 alanyl-tRNA editing protein [Alphaproteobacteria bacterium]
MELVFRNDAYARACDAVVTSAEPAGIGLDRTVFYPTGGGQPGDTGRLVDDTGVAFAVLPAVKGETDAVLHPLSEGVAPPRIGARVRAEIDWERRYRHMRMHTCLHLLSAVVGGGVTGGAVGEWKSRLDFDLPDPVLDKEVLETALNTLIDADHAVTARWIDESELDTNPELVRTMSVQPPRGAGRVRVLEIGQAVDLQPCGGTHVARTGEIGRVRIGKIEKKGRRNRRINVHLEEAGA